MQNNNKKYGLAKERQVKSILINKGALDVVRARGSFGSADVLAFFPNCCVLISVKSVRRKNASFNDEIKKLHNLKLPFYCQKELWVWWSPRMDRIKKGWEVISVL